MNSGALRSGGNRFWILLSLGVAGSVFASEPLQPISLADLAGSWKVACTPITNGSPTSEISQLDFTAGGEVTDFAEIFSDSSCQTPYLSETAQYDFSINADRLSAAATPFDIMLTFLSDAAVTSANQAPGACQLTDWKVGAARTVIGTPCGPRETINLNLGLVNATTLRVTVCGNGRAQCETKDYVHFSRH